MAREALALSALAVPGMSDTSPGRHLLGSAVGFAVYSVADQPQLPACSPASPWPTSPATAAGLEYAGYDEWFLDPN